MQYQNTAYPRQFEADGGRPVGARQAASPRLGSSAHFDNYREAIKQYPGPSYFATVKSYGENGGKLVLRTVKEPPQTHMSDPVERERKRLTGLSRELADPVSLGKSCARARSNIDDWLRMTCTQDKDWRLVTLTKRGGIKTREQVNEYVELFRRAVSSHYENVHVLAVPELHHGGGINDSTYHVHCILVFPQGVRPIYSVFHRMWYRCLGGTGKERGHETPGNVDFAPTRGGDGTRYTPVQAARYLAKYVTKDKMAGKIGQKRYTVSHGAAEPTKRYYWEPIDYNADATRARAVYLLRQWFPASQGYRILSKSFDDGGDTYHVFSAEPAPS